MKPHIRPIDDFRQEQAGEPLVKQLNSCTVPKYSSLICEVNSIVNKRGLNVTRWQVQLTGEYFSYTSHHLDISMTYLFCQTSKAFKLSYQIHNKCQSPYLTRLWLNCICGPGVVEPSKVKVNAQFKVLHTGYHMLLSCLQVHQEMLQHNKLLVGWHPLLYNMGSCC